MSRPNNHSRKARYAGRSTFRWVLAPPTMDDLIHLLSAWRIWILGGVVGAVLGACIYAAVPPPYRARATVNVDFHLEQAWPQSSDREQFYYLERETRKLVEIAMSDEVLQVVARDVPGMTVWQLRAGAAQLSQPGSGGWHFFGTDRDPQRAVMIASIWAQAFSDQLSRQLLRGEAGGLESFITAELTQAGSLKPERSIPLSTYMLASAITLLVLTALVLLLLHPST